jgi:aarF domain-containing kinase
MPQTSISDMSATMKQVRSSMEQDEQLKVLMAGFRGSNLDESDFANANVRMRLVTDTQDDAFDAALPLAYDPDAINRFAGTQCFLLGGGKGGWGAVGSSSGGGGAV